MGKTKLFGSNVVEISHNRIKKDDRKEGVYYYDIRHSDEGYEPATIENFVWVNYMLTIGFDTPIDLGEDGFIIISDCDSEVLWSII